MVLVQSIPIGRIASVRTNGVLLEPKSVDAKRNVRVGSRTVCDSCLVNRSIDVKQKLGPFFIGNRVFV